jgi:prepilin-type N-terminal cleavage/methylation domain-containing protein
MNKGFSLLELMLVLLIFTFLFGAILTVMTTQDRSWRTGYDKVTAQQEARKAVDNIARLLRESNPSWDIGGVLYPVVITSGNRIDFYQPLFDSEGNITTLRKVTYKLNPADATQLLRKVGTQDAVVVANNINSISFGAGCFGCSAFNCSSVAADCPVVKIDVTTEKAKQFSLSSQVTLRNTNITAAGVTVEEPAEGEF